MEDPQSAVEPQESQIPSSQNPDTFSSLNSSVPAQVTSEKMDDHVEHDAVDKVSIDPTVLPLVDQETIDYNLRVLTGASSLRKKEDIDYYRLMLAEKAQRERTAEFNKSVKQTEGQIDTKSPPESSPPRSGKETHSSTSTKSPRSRSEGKKGKTVSSSARSSSHSEAKKGKTVSSSAGSARSSSHSDRASTSSTIHKSKTKETVTADKTIRISSSKKDLTPSKKRLRNVQVQLSDNEVSAEDPSEQEDTSPVSTPKKRIKSTVSPRKSRKNLDFSSESPGDKCPKTPSKRVHSKTPMNSPARSTTDMSSSKSPTKSPRKTPTPSKSTPRKCETPTRKKTTATPTKSPTKGFGSPKKTATNNTPTKSPKKRSQPASSDSEEETVTLPKPPLKISQLHSSRDVGDITRSITGRIVELTEHVKTDDIAPNLRRRFVLVDNSSMIITYVYDEHFTFVDGDTISISNSIVKNGRLTIHHDTKCRLAKKLHISKVDRENASRLVIKPQNDYTQIKKLKKLPVRENCYYSVQGLVLEASGRKEVPVSKGRTAYCNELKVLQGSESMQVSLWGTAASKRVKPGQQILVQDGSISYKQHKRCNVLRNGFLDNVFVYPSALINEEVTIVSLKDTDSDEILDAGVEIQGTELTRLVAKSTLFGVLPASYQTYTIRQMSNVLPIIGNTATRGITITKFELLDFNRWTPDCESESEEELEQNQEVGSDDLSQYNSGENSDLGQEISENEQSDKNSDVSTVGYVSEVASDKENDTDGHDESLEDD